MLYNRHGNNQAGSLEIKMLHREFIGILIRPIPYHYPIWFSIYRSRATADQKLDNAKYVEQIIR